jgi:hypothetical protein
MSLNWALTLFRGKGKTDKEESGANSGGTDGVNYDSSRLPTKQDLEFSIVVAWS